MAMGYMSPGMNAMDRDYYSRMLTRLDAFGPVMNPVNNHEGAITTGLGPRELGTTINPFQPQIQALQAKIREGASRLEIGFGGVGKGNSQQQTPEAYGRVEREVLRELAVYNEVKTSTHASFQLAGLAGFGREGFSKQAQQTVLEEVRKAIDFASEATTGGAVVVHTGEWARPISEAPWAKDYNMKDGRPAYLGYGDEDKKAELPVVDARTGQIVGGIRKDQEIYEPKWILAKDYEVESKKKLSGRDLQGKPTTYKPNDFVDLDGNKLNPDKPDEMFRRLPAWDAVNTRFKVEPVTWDTLVARAKEFNESHPNANIRPEVLYAKLQIENQALQQRGASLFHTQRYEAERSRYYSAKDRLAAAERGEISAIPPELIEQAAQAGRVKDETDLKKLLPDAQRFLKQEMDGHERSMRHTHESSSAADVQAETLLARASKLETMEEYGLKQSGAAIAELAEHARAKTQKMMADVKARGGDLSKFSKIYIAPENVFTEQYGSHPDELMNIVKAGRDQFVENMKKKGLSESEARKEASEHIKTTIDIGHLNMWRKHLRRFDGEDDAAFDKRFETWTMGKVEEMHKKGMIGHIHLTDNLGYNDEHLSPGQGNAPIRAFVKRLAELGYDDFISEIGSFNSGTILSDTWTYLGAEHYKRGSAFGSTQFKDLQSRHFGSYAPPMFIYGAYSPSNEFTLWSQVPLE